jgi:hypothetical protein
LLFFIFFIIVFILFFCFFFFFYFFFFLFFINFFNFCYFFFFFFFLFFFLIYNSHRKMSPYRRRSWMKENPRMMPTKVAIIRRSPDTSPALNTRVPDTMASVATVLSGGIAKTIALVTLQTRKQQHTEPKGNTRQTRAPIEEPKRPSAGKPGLQRRKPKGLSRTRSTKRMRSNSQATNPSIRSEQQRNAGRKPEYLT